MDASGHFETGSQVKVVYFPFHFTTPTREGAAPRIKGGIR